MPPKTYRKLIVTQFGTDLSKTLDIVEVPYEAPAPNEILVRNFYAGVNINDLLLVAGDSVLHVTPPFDLGVEAAGEVVEVGTEVQQFTPGDQVITAIYGNGFREYSTIDANLALLVSRATQEVMSLAVSGVTASIALEVVVKIQSHQTVLVTNAAGSSGHYAAQLAYIHNNQVIGVCHSESQAALLQSLGCCERIIDLSREDLDAVLSAEFPSGVNLVYESMGGHIFDTCLRHLSLRGRLVSVGSVLDQKQAANPLHTLHLYNHLLRKSAAIYGFWLSDYAQFIRTHFTHLLELYYADKLRAIVDRRHFEGLEEVPAALEYLLSGANTGKVVVRFSKELP